MSLEEVCQACLSTGRTMFSLLESIVPKFDTLPDSVVDQWKIFTKILAHLEDGCSAKICKKCLTEIQRTYSFILKCERSENILKKIKNIKICLKRLKIVSVTRDNSSHCMKSGNDINPSSNMPEIKTEKIEWNDRNNGYDGKDADRCQNIHTNVDNDEDQRSQPTEGANLGMEHVGHDNDFTKDVVSAAQHIKQESDLDLGICMENDALDGIESNKLDKNSVEIGQFEVNIHANVNNDVNTRSHHTLIACKEHSIFGADKIDQLGSENGVKKDAVSATQDIKQESELNICMENDAIYEIESDDESSTEIFKCPACRYECGVRAGLEKHLVDSHIAGQMCKLCNKEFKCTAIVHCFKHLHVYSPKVVDKTLNLKQHKCEVCTKEFSYESNFKKHLKIHTEERPFKCENCPEAFQRHYDLACHLKIHWREKSFKCAISPGTVSQQINLTDYLRRHSTARPFKCEICSKAFPQKKDLTEHVRNHSADRPFKCDFCPKTFVFKVYLTRHLGYHTGERPFKCEFCPETFRQKGDLMRHRGRHTEKRFKCHICLKTFRHKITLSTHSKYHMRPRPFKCEICHKTYLCEFGLLAHLKRLDKDHLHAKLVKKRLFGELVI